MTQRCDKDDMIPIYSTGAPLIPIIGIIIKNPHHEYEVIDTHAILASFAMSLSPCCFLIRPPSEHVKAHGEDEKKNGLSEIQRNHT